MSMQNGRNSIYLKQTEANNASDTKVSRGLQTGKLLIFQIKPLNTPNILQNKFKINNIASLASFLSVMPLTCDTLGNILNL